jgi:hypothetical protein
MKAGDPKDTKLDREQDRAEQQGRIRDAVRDFYQHGLPALQAKRTTPRTAQPAASPFDGTGSK